MNLNKQNTPVALLSLGMVILLMAAVMPLVGMTFQWIKYVYAIGALFTLVARLIDRYTGKNVAIRRLSHIQSVSSICYCISAATLCVPMGEYVSEKDWLAFLLAGAVLQIYSSWRIQQEEQKESKKDCKAP